MLSKTLKTFLITFAIFFIIILVSTWGLLSGFFEQDEWKGIADVMYSYNRPLWEIFIPAQIHFSPLGVFLWSTLYKVFKFHSEFYFLFGLVIHASTSALIFIFTQRITKNKYISLIASILFLLNGRSYQAFTHLALVHSTTSTMFLIMLFTTYLSGIKENILSYRNSLLLLLIFFAAVFIREEGFIIVPIFISYLICFNKQKINKKNIKYFIILSLGFLFIIFLRYFAQSLYTEPIPVQYQISGNGVEYNLLTIPIKLVVQNIVNSITIAVITFENTKNIYPNLTSYFSSQAPIMDAAYFYISSIFAGIVGFWLWFFKPKRIGIFISFFAIWIGANAFMLSFVGRELYILEPRYLYYSSFPVFCFLAIFLQTIFTNVNKYLFVNYFLKIIVLILLIIMIITSIFEIRTAVEYMSRSGTIKKEIFKELILVHPKLDSNSVLFIQCSASCRRNTELGIPNENVLPFSSGPGMNILVYYASIQNEEKEWGPFLTKHFLFHTFSQDYKRIGERSYGYFTNKAKLEEAIINNNISKKDIVALEYNEDNYSFTNISKEFIKTLK